jgi:indole-3-glycerol phosphate synthase
MVNHLDAIIRRKREEIAALTPCATTARSCDNRFSEALRAPRMAIIAEIKRRSPALGRLAPIADPAALARHYQEGGAAAISVLTDGEGFGGSFDDLRRVAAGCQLPVVCKDFILERSQVDLAVQAGASAVLLIVAALREKLWELLAYVQQMGLEALVEVHDESELALAVAARASIIGVNNRNLQTFEIDLQTAIRLRCQIPQGILTIAESGIQGVEDVRRMREAGYDAVLIGQALVMASNPGDLLARMGQC